MEFIDQLIDYPINCASLSFNPKVLISTEVLLMSTLDESFYAETGKMLFKIPGNPSYLELWLSLVFFFQHDVSTLQAVSNKYPQQVFSWKRKNQHVLADKTAKTPYNYEI